MLGYYVPSDDMYLCISDHGGHQETEAMGKGDYTLIPFPVCDWSCFC